MIPKDSEAKPNELPCWAFSILNYIKEEYKSMEKGYKQVDELFDLPETKERNMGILTSYFNFYKKSERFHNLVNHATNQVLTYDYNLRLQTFTSKVSKEFCQKNLDKMTDYWWTKDLGTLVLYDLDVNHTCEKITNHSKRIDSLLQKLETGMSCMEEQLKKEKRTLMNYVHDLGKKKRELEYFTKHRGELRPDFFTANTKSLEISLETLYCGIVAKSCDIESIMGWLDVSLSKAKSPKKIDELEKKLTLAFEMDNKYSNLATEAEKIMNDALFKEQASLTFEQLKKSIAQKEQPYLKFKN